MRIPVVVQTQPGENGAAALSMMLGYYRRYVPMKEMREKCVSSRNGSSPEQILSAAESFGLKGEILNVEADELKNMKLPILVQWKRKYFCIIKGFKGSLVSVADPAKGEYQIEFRKFKELFCNKVIKLSPGSDFKPGGKRESLFALIVHRTKGLRRPMFTLAILTVATILISLELADINKEIIDGYLKTTPSEDDMPFIVIGAIYVGFLLLSLVLSLTKTKITNSVSRRKSAVSGSDLFKKMFAQPMKFFEQYSAGELMQRIENNIKVDNSVLNSLVPRIIDAVMTVVYIVYLVHFNWILALVCFVIVLANILVNFYIQNRNAIASRSMTTTGGSLNSSVLNGINMIDSIKSSGSERAFYNMWYESQVQNSESKLRSQRITATSAFISNMFGYSLTMIQLFLGAYLISNGALTLGTLSLFQSVLNNMRTSMENCLGTVNSLQTMRTNIERVNDITERETKEPIPLPESEYETTDKLKGVLEAENVSFRYNKGDPLAVDNVSIKVDEGQMIAIVGASGCGKSTLIKVLADLYEAESGKILYGGKLRKDIPDVVFHSSVLTMDQEAVVFEDTIYNNITVWDSTIENYEVAVAARDAQIHNRITRERLGYGDVIRENGRNFSGGELQRLEIARALAHEPRILFLDEFTSALDALTEDKVINNIRRKGTTCIIVAHRLSTIVDCDRIYVMDKGKVVQEGKHEELYSQEGLYRELISMQ